MVSAKIAHTTKHGALSNKSQLTETVFYNLDAIISVGYRVNSKKATRFRQWATSVLKEYMIKIFAMDDEFNKNQTIVPDFDQHIQKMLDEFN